MSTWTGDELTLIGDITELQVAVQRGDGTLWLVPEAVAPAVITQGEIA